MPEFPMIEKPIQVPPKSYPCASGLSMAPADGARAVLEQVREISDRSRAGPESVQASGIQVRTPGNPPGQPRNGSWKGWNRPGPLRNRSRLKENRSGRLEIPQGGFRMGPGLEKFGRTLSEWVRAWENSPGRCQNGSGQGWKGPGLFQNRSGRLEISQGGPDSPRALMEADLAAE